MVTSKFFFSSMFAATSLWVAGCQHRSIAQNRHGSDATCCSVPTAPAPITPRSGNLRPQLRPEPADVFHGEQIIILPDQPATTKAQPDAVKPVPPRPLPFTEKAVVPMDPLPAANKVVPPTIAPREQPLPAPAFPDVLPAPTNSNLQRSSHQTLVVNQADSTTAVFRTLTGEVQQFRRSLRLRYAAIDVEDTHGGSVELTGSGLEQIQEGARIRVSGILIPAADRQSSARFQVQTVDILER